MRYATTHMAVESIQREWFIGQETTEHGLCIEELISDRWVVVAYLPDDYRYHDRAVANARLILTAPELLEALQHAHDYLAASGWEGDPRMHKIIAALDKAEGRT
jgi:hypothetical protein